MGYDVRGTVMFRFGSAPYSLRLGGAFDRFSSHPACCRLSGFPLLEKHEKWGTHRVGSF
jgi:hypothetical protein